MNLALNLANLLNLIDVILSFLKQCHNFLFDGADHHRTHKCCIKANLVSILDDLVIDIRGTSHNNWLQIVVSNVLVLIHFEKVR